MKLRKRNILTIVIGIILLVPVYISTASGQQMSPQSTIGSSGSDQKDLDIACTGESGLERCYMVYEDESRGPGKTDIHFRKSADGGFSFGSFGNFMESPDGDDRQIDPSIAAYDNGTGDIVVVCYVDNSPGSNALESYIVSRTSFDSGGNWSERVLVTNDSMSGYPNNRMRNTDICFDPDGNLFLVWEEDQNIRMVRSDDKGMNWSEPVVVSEHGNPQNSAYHQRKPSVAATEDDVVVAFESDCDFKFYVFSSSSGTDGSVLSFSDPELVPEYVYPMYRTYDPRVVASGGVFHLVFWDFSTDSNGNDNENRDVDRPSVSYTRSTDGGDSWGVGTARSIRVNATTDCWKSAPDVSSASSNSATVAFMDDSSGTVEVYFRSTSDGGKTWTGRSRANQYHENCIREAPRINSAGSGEILAAWEERMDPGSDLDIVHSRTVDEKDPLPVTDVRAISVYEDEAVIGWTPNSEADFNGYTMYLNGTSNFTISANSLINSSGIQGLDRINVTDLEPDTRYYFKIRVTDKADRTNISKEISFKTLPVNQPPVFMMTPPPIYMEEDSERKEAMNLSKWEERGWVADDHFNGYHSLRYEVIFLSDDPNLRAVFRDRSLEQPYWILDIIPIGKDWYGEEVIRIRVIDPGKDGGFGSPDDLSSMSDPFPIIVNSTNDDPFWSAFQDLNTGTRILIDGDMEKLVLPSDRTGCIEGRQYSFSITGDDTDGDFLEFSVSDSRIDVGIDPDHPRTTSVFRFTPQNRDVPFVETVISMDDGNGGVSEMVLVIPVENVNQAPFFHSIDGEIIEENISSLNFSIVEEDILRFSIGAMDHDPGDILELRSDSDRVQILETDGNIWNITYTSREGDSLTGHVTFVLDLYDRMKEHVPLTVIVHVRDDQKPPEWLPDIDPVEIDPTYDRTDINEKAGVNEFGGPNIRAEWNEPVTITGNARDPDGDTLVYGFVIEDIEGNIQAEYSGRTVIHSFIPSLTDLSSDEKFLITLNVTDGNFPGIQWTRELWVHSDIDNDNDGMIDSLEILYFGSIEDCQGDDDPDGDGIPNLIEIGVRTPGNTNPRDNGTSLPGNSNANGHESGIENWMIVSGSIIAVLVVMILTGMLVIFRRSRRREKEEELDIERRVSEMNRRTDEIRGLYGRKDTDEFFGVDQSTLSDLDMDLGGQIYHENGGLHSGRIPPGKSEAGGEAPDWRSADGPLFLDDERI